MRYINIIIKRFSLFLLSILISCLFGCDEEPYCFDSLKPNKEIQINSGEFPLTIPTFVNWRGETDLNSLIADSDLIAICQVNSVFPTEQSPLLYYCELDTDLKQYINCFVTCYDLILCEVLKGNHSMGEKITFTYPTDNQILSWPTFLFHTDECMITNQKYLVFLKCCENSFTDAEHQYVNKAYSIYAIDNETFELPNVSDNPLKGITLTELSTRITNGTVTTQGKMIDDFYSEPLNYMTTLSDICCYQSETQLINTSDDIIVGRITKAETFNGEINFFSRNKSMVNGKILTVRITENIKGTHKAGDEIKVFVRRDDEKDRLLAGEYVSGINVMFFLSCMDNLSSYHLMNGELQASIIICGDNVYNRANHTIEAQNYGFIGLGSFVVYRILFSNCFTLEQLIENVRDQVVELPNRITYGEYLEIS